MRLPRHKLMPVRPQGLPVIVFKVGDFAFAIAASAVSEIQSLRDVPSLLGKKLFGKICGSVIRDERHHWVVDANVHFHLMPTCSKRVLLLAGTPVALRVDSILRMTELPKVLPLPHAFRGEERNWYLGLAVIDNQVIPVVNPASFLSEETLRELEASLPPLMKSQAVEALA